MVNDEWLMIIDERKWPWIRRELKEIGLQADEVGEQQLPAIGQQLKKINYLPWMICEPNEKEGRKLMAEIMGSVRKVGCRFLNVVAK